MVNQIIGLAILGGAGWYLINRQGQSQGGSLYAFGESGIPYAPGETAGEQNGGLGGVLDLSFMDDLFPTQPRQSGGYESGGIVDLINGTGSIWDMTKARGIRNNNPGNIEDTGTNWQGIDSPRNDGRFLRFTDPVYGIRAIARVLDTYANRHGINTIAGIVNRWAPSFENNVSAYAQHLANRLGVGVNEPINVMSRRPELIEGIIMHENGEQPYPRGLINQGVALA